VRGGARDLRGFDTCVACGGCGGLVAGLWRCGGLVAGVAEGFRAGGKGQKE
jgi:hypothetical protein